MNKRNPRSGFALFLGLVLGAGYLSKKYALLYQDRIRARDRGLR